MAASAPAGKTEVYGSAACMFFSYGIRILAGLSGAGCAVMAVFGWITLSQGNNVIKMIDCTGSGDSPAANQDAQQNFLMAFQGIALTYLVLFGVMILLSELRFEFVKEYILEYFKFLEFLLGRAFFHFFVATLTISSGNVYGIIVGSCLLAAGVCEIVLSIFLNKQRGAPAALPAVPKSSSNANSGMADDPTAFEGAGSSRMAGAADEEAAQSNRGTSTKNPFLSAMGDD